MNYYEIVSLIIRASQISQFFPLCNHFFKNPFRYEKDKNRYEVDKNCYEVDNKLVFVMKWTVMKWMFLPYMAIYFNTNTTSQILIAVYSYAYWSVYFAELLIFCCLCILF